MANKNIPKPTDGELAILKILWQSGAATVRQVNEKINTIQPAGYTTTLKMMQIMIDKGLLVRDSSKRTHVYAPAVSEEITQNQLVGSLLEKAFAGSAEKLVMRALSAKKITEKELVKIKKMLNNINIKNEGE